MAPYSQGRTRLSIPQIEWIRGEMQALPHGMPHTGCCNAACWMDERPPVSLSSAMGRRRSNREHLAIAGKPHWLAVYRAPERQPLESTPLPPGTDLTGIMRDAITRLSAAGWVVEGDGAFGFFFCHLGKDRLEVRIQSVDPNQPVPLNNTSPFGPSGSE